MGFRNLPNLYLASGNGVIAATIILFFKCVRRNQHRYDKKIYEAEEISVNFNPSENEVKNYTNCFSTIYKHYQNIIVHILVNEKKENKYKIVSCLSYVKLKRQI